MITAVLTVMTSVALSAGAFTVNVDGKEYTFASRTPTKGDFNVPVIRAGFADVDRDGEVSIIDAAWIQRYSVYMKSPDGIGEPVRDL